MSEKIDLRTNGHGINGKLYWNVANKKWVLYCNGNAFASYLKKRDARNDFIFIKKENLGETTDENR